MSEIVTPSGLVNELTVITDDDTISEVNVPGEAFNRQIKKSVDRTYFQKNIKDGTETLNPRSFTSGRFDSQELVSGTLSVSGWYTIAETTDNSIDSASGEISVVSELGRGLGCIFGMRPSSSARTHENTTIKLKSFYSDSVPGVDIQSFRIAKSDASQTTGFKIQMKIIGGDSYNIQLRGNISRITRGGAFLVAPYLDDTPTLPDGSTVGTFLEAGEELSFDSSDLIPAPDWIAYKISNDSLACSVLWQEIPKQGTGLTLTPPANDLKFIDGNGAQGTLGSFSISNFNITDKRISFRINQTGIATSLLDTAMSWPRINGANCKLTIT